MNILQRIKLKVSALNKIPLQYNSDSRSVLKNISKIDEVCQQLSSLNRLNHYNQLVECDKQLNGHS